jgi:hypothetical protein
MALDPPGRYHLKCCAIPLAGIPIWIKAEGKVKGTAALRRGSMLEVQRPERSPKVKAFFRFFGHFLDYHASGVGSTCPLAWVINQVENRLAPKPSFRRNANFSTAILCAVCLRHGEYTSSAHTNDVDAFCGGAAVVDL